jgi:hypothetical protein
MSFAASVARDLLLTARNADLEFQINLLSENLQQLTAVAASLFSLAANIQPGSPESQLLSVRQAQLAQVEKGIEIQLDKVRSQQKAVAAEIEAVRKTITDDINRSFKTFANA